MWVVPLLVLCVVQTAVGQTWRKTAPDEIEQVPASTGAFVAFPNVLLPAGVRYHVHASQAAQTSNQGDSNDAMYYFRSGLQLVPNAIFPTVGLKIKYDGMNENWFSSPTVKPFQSGYQPSHIYDASVMSTGAALGFRFYDRQDPPSSYYNDNKGDLLLEVTQETPGIAVYRDTLDFGAVGFRFPHTLPDSIESYGTEPLNVTFLAITGSGAFSYTSERGSGFQLPDRSTNAFQVTFAPTALGKFTGHLDIHSTNAMGGDTDRIIVLLGSGHGAVLTATPDTLDFGTVGVGGNKTLNEMLKNVGDSAAQVVSASITPSNIGFAIGGLPTTASAGVSTGLGVTFTPPSVGAALAKIDLTLDNGARLSFFAKGVGALGVMFLSADTLDFGTVLFGASRTLTDTMLNVGASDLTITSITNSNPAEFNIVGNLNPRVVTAMGSGDVYTVTFTPTTHVPNLIHVAYWTFTYDGGTTRTVTMIGREHTPLDAVLRIDTTYFGKAGNDVAVTQKLTTDLSGTVSPVALVREKILYNPNVLSYRSSAKGSLTSGSDWTLVATNPIPGEIDITLRSTKSGLGGPGPLLTLQFHILETDRPRDTSHFTQVDVDMGGGLEPLIALSQGRLTVLDGCAPLLAVGTIATSIEPNSPNPFRESTRIGYWINEPSATTRVKLTLYDALGTAVQQIVDADEPNGHYSVHINGAKLATGVYTLLFEAGGTHRVSRVVVAK